MRNRINRKRLYKALGLANCDKMPKDFCGIFHGIEVYSRSCDAAPWTTFTIVVRTTDEVRRYGHRKSSAHRTFVQCPCGRLIPTGRIHQHTHQQTK